MCNTNNKLRVYETFQSNPLLRKNKNNKLTMKNISNKKSWHSGAVQIYVDPNPAPLIKINLNLNIESDYVIFKLYRKPMS